MITRFHGMMLFGLFFFFLLYGCSSNNKPENNYVIMLSLDGFRWDYPELYDTPNLDKIASHGVRAKSLKPCFPTKTFPNHYSIATGLYPDHHGIVQNSFYDSALERYYSIHDRESVEDPSFYSGEPIWITAEKQGIISASYFWIGSEAPVDGMYPTFWKKYDHSFPFQARADSVIAWLQLPEKNRPRLILWYIDEPDSKGHDYGPDSPGLSATIEYLDGLIGVFIAKLDELPIRDRINLIITSDHGMGTISPECYHNLHNFVDTSLFEVIIGYNPNYLFQAKPGFYEEAYEDLEDVPHVSFWESDNLPDRFHYGNNPRTLDFVMVADSSWSIGWREPDDTFPKGGHGYDNENTDMHAIYYATGPDFKEGYVHDVFMNIDIYSLISHILQITPSETDGNFERVKGMLKD